MSLRYKVPRLNYSTILCVVELSGKPIKKNYTTLISLLKVLNICINKPSTRNINNYIKTHKNNQEAVVNNLI